MKQANIGALRFLEVASCVILGIVCVACAPGSTLDFAPDKGKTLITLLPDNATINVGQQLPFTVQLTKGGVTTNADPTLFNWVSSGPSVATVDDHGVALGIKAGNVTIQAQAKSDHSNSGGAGLTVQAAPPVATLAAMPEAMLLRFTATDREVSYTIDGARHLLRTTVTYADGSISQGETLAPELTGMDWLALDAARNSLYVLSRATRQILSFRVDPLSGELSERPVRIRVDADVFAIAVQADGAIKLHHLTGHESRIQARRQE